MEKTNALLIEQMRSIAGAMRKRAIESGCIEPLTVSLLFEGAAVIENFEKMRELGAVDTAADLRVLYICDRRKCDECSPDCKHTRDVRHAKHFEVTPLSHMIAEVDLS